MYFSSKRGAFFALIILGVTILVIREMIVSKGSVFYIVGTLIIVLLLWLWFGTGYKIEDGLLKIRFGPFRSTVKIEDIKRLKATNTLLAGPALSFDRIEILYKKYDVAIISPKDRIGFVRVLLTENKYIEVDNNLFHDKVN